MVTSPSGAGRVAARMAELIAARVPFVHATVVRAQCPTSAHPGDAALVLGDGSFEGFVGGQCAEGSVRTASLDVLARGEALLLRILPEGEEAFPDAPGARTVVNPCLSGGAVEVFLEPMLPAPLLAVVGTSPIADAVAELAEPLGFAVSRDGDGPARPAGATAVVISSHGRFEDESIRAALDAGVGLIGLVASHTRGAAVLEGLALTDDERARVRTPIGVEIGATTAGEIALSIMAEIVRAVRVDGLTAAGPAPAPVAVQALDPVCGMTVVIGPDTPHLAVDGREHWFCGTGCRDRFAADAAG
ncbi:MAG: XdhC family protein [Acidimicrobiales bacterium]